MALFTGTFSSAGSVVLFDKTFNWDANGSLSVDIKFTEVSGGALRWETTSVSGQLVATGSIVPPGDPQFIQHVNFSGFSTISTSAGGNGDITLPYSASLAGNDGDHDNGSILLTNGQWNSTHTAITCQLKISVFDYKNDPTTGDTSGTLMYMPSDSTYVTFTLSGAPDPVPPPKPQPTVSVADAKPVLETGHGPLFATFVVSIDKASKKAVTVEYSTHDGTAVAGVDYQARSGILKFAPGQTTAIIKVPVTVETFTDPFRTFTVHLSHPSGAKLGDNVGIADIHMPTEYCLYDFDGDGASTGVEIRVSDASATFEDAERNLAHLEYSLPFAKAHLDQLLADKNAAQLSLNVREAKAVADAAIEAASVVTDEFGITMLTHVASMVSTTIATAIDPAADIDPLVQTAGLEALGTTYDIAEEASELVGHMGAIKDPIEKVQAIIHTTDPSAEDVIAATNHLVFVEGRVFELQTLVGEIKADIAHYKAVRDAAATCVQEVKSTLAVVNKLGGSAPARPHQSTNNAFDFRSFDFDFRNVPSTHHVASNPAHLSHEAGLATVTGLVSILDNFPLHAPTMPDDFFVAKGTAAGELFHATADDLGGDSKSVCLIDSGSGNDKVLVSYGSIYINDRAGNDSVFLYQTGGLASIDDIVLQRVHKTSPTIVTLGLANGLFLATKGVENFTFSEGTFHLVKGRLIFKAADGNTQVLNGSAGDDAITGSALPELINGLAGNDSLSGLGGDDTLIGGFGNDTLDGGVGNNTAVYASAKGGVTVNLGLVGAQNTGPLGLDTLLNIQNLTGSNFGDALTGDNNANILTGLAGNDLLSGGGGDDTLIGGVGNDSMDGGAGNDTASYATASKAVTINLATTTPQNTIGAGVDTLTAIENLIGSRFNDKLTGDGADNIIEGGAGNDLLSGGTNAAGGDTASYAHAAAGVKVSLAIATVQNTIGAGKDTLTGFENLIGSAFADTLTGDGAANILTGLGGDDTIDGGASGDTMRGGFGNDSYVVDNAGDIVDETGGGGIDTVRASITFSLADAVHAVGEVENLTLLAGAVNGTGNALDNIIVGNSAANILTGGAGADTLNGGVGADTLLGGLGGDIYVVDQGGDVVNETGGDGIDTVVTSVAFSLTDAVHAIGNIENVMLTGTAALNLTGNGLDNVLAGNAGANTLTGAGGSDTLDGGGGADTMLGGVGSDIYMVDNAGDVVDETGGDGIDTVRASITFSLSDAVHVKGIFENLTLTGTDSIGATGNGLGNILIGNDANNILSGLAGADTMTGGLGIDRFVFTDITGGADTITDFEAHLDKIVIDFVAGGAEDLDANDFFLTTDATGPAIGQKALLYNKATGVLSYDADGAGGGSAVQVALLAANTDLSKGDLLFLA